MIKLDAKQSAVNRDRGMTRAAKHADIQFENWTQDAYDFLLSFVKTKDVFMIEEVRAASVGVIPLPPDNRAWGSVAHRAARAGFIYRVEYRGVSNIKAHKARGSDAVKIIIAIVSTLILVSCIVAYVYECVKDWRNKKKENMKWGI